MASAPSEAGAIDDRVLPAVTAGEAVAPGAWLLGQTASKPGHRIEFSKLPSAGTECTRAHHKAVKKAPKNITSEKMNQLMLQR